MDVVRFRARRVFATLMPVFFLAACSKDKVATAPPAFQEVSSECASTAIKDRFLVHWKDGSISIEHARDREDFLKKIMEPYEDEITLAENDQVVRLHEPQLEMKAASNASVASDWGQTMIEAPTLWSHGIRGDGVIVAVIDSGVDLTHPQLRDQLAINTAEIPNNGIDDDENGLIDDFTGYDFQRDTGEVEDTSRHGTHVAGIIAANPNAGSVTGVAPGAKILPLDFMSKEGAGSISAAIKAILYAVNRGAKVINASWGGGECSASLRQTMQEVSAKGVLFVVAAGNAASSLDFSPEYPAAFHEPTQLTVAASSFRDLLAGFSNYSYNLVHLAAPGSAIISTVPGGGVASMSGTSMAAPFVSGAAALLWSSKPDATVAEIRDAILQGVDLDPSDPKGVLPVITGGRLNVRKAYEHLSSPTP